MMQSSIARSPGKLILSGEHAVLYGQPALAMAVNWYSESHVLKRFTPGVFFNFLNLDYAKSFTQKTLTQLKDRLHRDYRRFLKGQCSIREVLKKPFELLQYAVTIGLENMQSPLSHGVEIRTHSDIPMGCGMGSSAAAVMSTLYAICHFLQIPLSTHEYVSWGTKIENLQHGRSSGLDLRLALLGGCVHYQQGESVARALPKFPFYIIHTGVPETSTGECVAFVKPSFQDAGMTNAFGAMTHEVDRALQAEDVDAFKSGIRENHRLLNHIGVVPQTVQAFIAEIEQAGGAAKICGSGASRGEAAGMVLVMMPQVEELNHLATRYGYRILPIEGDTRGTYIYDNLNQK
jgi:mevalonate kinase